MPEILIWIRYQGLRKYEKLYDIRGKNDVKYVTLNVSPHHFDRIQFCDGR